MKKLFIIYAAGILTAFGYLIHLGGENLVQLGLKLSAAEAKYDFVATPRFPEVTEEASVKKVSRK